ncbi:pre-mRNA-splicing factor prp46 [Coniosporium apollinis CBS 100218]|uniref:Pre-mRNA-splicing factor PRP46 n=1 Tax=Coniosporium apollinis (strain CBS 100218) TaxID=1168221 RepID=R7YH19_CONA1|nr:pre-mRNA-splicing factor prp46 [Coniosporium apollinis CBS 100218]EON61202.1 pre-mRNA-splicing factor prp46 [Coniosporium apollinis CBS 100218]
MTEIAPSAPLSTPNPEILLRTSAKRTRELFASDFGSLSGLESASQTVFSVAPAQPSPLELASRTSLSSRIRSEYADATELPPALAQKQASAAAMAAARRKKPRNQDEAPLDPKIVKMIEGISEKSEQAKSAGISNALTVRARGAGALPPNANGPTPQRNTPSSALVRKDTVRQAKPDWHAPWKLMRVISGHLGWVRALAVEPNNQWFASGAGDRTIKIWDLASGTCRLTLTGHISTVRGLAVSDRHPYLFSCGEDKMVKCWDLETNKVIRHYHGHLSGVYTLSLHPTLDVLVTGGRDGVARVWDMRTRSNIHVLSGHKGTVSDVKCQEADPQVISSSLDSTIRMWDLAAGKTMGVLTHHKKGVRALAVHPKEFTFASGSTGTIKQWKCPEGAFMQNFEGHNSIINTLAVNEDNVLFSGGDNGSVSFWDWKTGHRFQSLESIAQPGSLDAEAGLMSSTFDKTGLRLITGEADKTIKVWKPDDEATPETHPLEWKPTLGRQKF